MHWALGFGFSASPMLLLCTSSSGKSPHSEAAWSCLLCFASIRDHCSRVVVRSPSMWWWGRGLLGNYWALECSRRRPYLPALFSAAFGSELTWRGKVGVVIRCVWSCTAPCVSVCAHPAYVSCTMCPALQNHHTLQTL
jgi:hypothetical protein